MLGAGWTDDATRALLSIWEEHNIQEQLDGVKRNKHIYNKIASELSEIGYEFTAKQCITKVKNLVQSYRKALDHNCVSGNDRKHCAYFEQLDEILGTQETSEPPLVLQNTPSGAGSEQSENQEESVFGETPTTISEDDPSEPIPLSPTAGPSTIDLITDPLNVTKSIPAVPGPSVKKVLNAEARPSDLFSSW